MSAHAAVEGPDGPIVNWVDELRANLRMRDGYFLRDELADLYLLGVLRGMEVGLLEAMQDDGTMDREARLEELSRTASSLLGSVEHMRA